MKDDAAAAAGDAGERADDADDDNYCTVVLTTPPRRRMSGPDVDGAPCNPVGTHATNKLMTRKKLPSMEDRGPTDPCPSNSPKVEVLEPPPNRLRPSVRVFPH